MVKKYIHSTKINKNTIVIWPNLAHRPLTAMTSIWSTPGDTYVCDFTSCKNLQLYILARFQITNLHVSIFLNYAGFRLRLAARHFVAWSPLAISWFITLCGHAALVYHQIALLLSWIEVNCMRSAAVGKAARFSIYWQDAACCSVIPLQQVVMRSCTNIIIKAAMRRAAS